jgi:phosphatidylserine decarboxylase
VPVIGVCAALAFWVHLAWLVPVGVLLPVWLFIVAFFRDPNRTIPTDPDAVVSPADGVITHVDEVEEPGFPGGRAFRISIFLSVFNVHVNRLPRAGKVKRIAYYPGEFLDARHHECSRRNEQLWVDLEDERTGCLVRVKQTAGAIARRIVCWLRLGETVAAGERYGMIKFGSRTEVLLPTDAVAEVKVRVGQAVKGGRDVLLQLRPSEERQN